jgi:hypothetical protein
MDISFCIKIIRDVIAHTQLNALISINTSLKADGTKVTNIDSFVEQIVLDHLLEFLPEHTVFIGEETSADHLLSIHEIGEASTIVTIDGIDGTDYFIQHCQDRQANDKWLIALTAIYQRNLDTGLFDPILAFAFQPQSDRLFCYAEESATCIVHPLSNPIEYALNVDHVNTDGIRGSIDIYLDKAQCPHAIADSSVYQKGPSGFNMVSLLSACNPNIAENSEVNFTSFHYALWDFGLWPILKAAGFATTDYEHLKNRFSALDLHWFGQPDAVLGKITRPLLIAPDKLMASLAGVITHKLPK